MDKDMLANELYLMDKGVRDCCETTIGGTPTEIGEKLYDIESMCLDYKYHVVSFLLEKEEDREYRSVFICKYNYQKILLNKLFNEVKPHSFIYEYMMGTLLGYSAASMEEFLMRKHTDEFASITKYNDEEEKEGKVTIKSSLTEFDKDAWQVLMLLNNNCTPVSDKMNALTDLLYTDTSNSREKGLVHELSTAVSLIDVNSPNFGICIRILEKYFHVDTEDEETNTSSADENKIPFFDNELWNLLDGFRACPSGYEHNLEVTKEFVDEYTGKFETRSDAWNLIRNLRSVLLCLESPEKKSEIISNLLEKFYAKYDSGEQLNVEQYFERAAGLYGFLNAGSFLKAELIPEDYLLTHIKKFIDITPPHTFLEARLFANIESIYYDESLPKDKKIEAVNNTLHKYLFSKKKVEEKLETNESIDPYKQLVNKLYSDLRHAVSDSEFVSILNKFLEKDACYKGDKAFQQSLKWEIDNEYGKSKCFRFNVTKKIAEYLRR